MSKRQAIAVTRDAAGNTLTDGTGRTLTWDSWGNLSSVTKVGITTSYVYNYRHQRVKKTLSNGTVTLYHYDESDRLIMETNGTGTVQAMYFYLDDNTPFALMYAANSPNNNTAQDQIIYLHTDHLGTPRLATDSTKKLIWRWESDAFGSTLANQDPDADGKATVINLRFPGQYYDAESGLHYNWNRYYDPASGRYVSSDLIGLRGGTNTFGYVDQSPLVFGDWSGLEKCWTLPIRLPFYDVQLCKPDPVVVPPPVTTNPSNNSATKDESCDDDKVSCSKASGYQLEQAGIDNEHEFKDEFVSTGGSRYDICACTDGSIKIAGHGQCGRSGPKIDTWAKWK